MEQSYVNVRAYSNDQNQHDTDRPRNYSSKKELDEGTEKERARMGAQVQK